MPEPPEAATRPGGLFARRGRRGPARCSSAGPPPGGHPAGS